MELWSKLTTKINSAIVAWTKVTFGHITYCANTAIHTISVSYMLYWYFMFFVYCGILEESKILIFTFWYRMSILSGILPWQTFPKLSYWCPCRSTEALLIKLSSKLWEFGIKIKFLLPSCWQVCHWGFNLFTKWLCNILISRSWIAKRTNCRRTNYGTGLPPCQGNYNPSSIRCTGIFFPN